MSCWISCIIFVVFKLVHIVCGDDWHHVNRRSIRKTASIGGSKILECEIQYPGDQWVEHIITWRKQDIEVPVFIQFHGYPPHIDTEYQGRIRLIEQASIELSEIRISDEGWYECSIVFLDGNDESNTNGTWIYLSVNSPPVLGEASPSFLIQKQDATVDLFCDATATPEPTLTWYKDGKQLQVSDRVLLQGNRVQISELKREDGGVYTCTFKNTVGQVSHIIKMVIEGNAYIMVPPKNTTMAEGSRVKLQCQAEGYPNNITYRWYKDQKDVNQVPGLMSRAGIYADGSLVINSVKKEDTGWYLCRPTNGLGPPPEAKAYLNVTYFPRVLSMPVRLYLPKGMLGKIECPTEANPPVTMTLWHKNDVQIDFTQTDRMKVNKQGTLVLKEVTDEDEGLYRCTPFSPLGAGRSSTPVQVNVRDPPHFVVRPDHTYQRKPSQSVTMPCIADGDPKPIINWRKADGTFPQTTKTLQDEGNLTIVNLAKEDHGTYECVATNVVTSIVTTTLLIIELTTPHAPYNVSATTTEYSATIRWLPAFDGGYPQHYVLWYKHVKSPGSEDGTHDWQTVTVVPDRATSVTVHRLLPHTNYQFTVLSRNTLGDGLFSKIITARTKGQSEPISETTSPPTTPYSGPLPSHPYDLTIAQNEKGDLNISWLPPKHTLVQITSYAIRFRTVGKHWVILADNIRNQNWYLWTTVSRGAVYHFRVYSFSHNIRSNESSEIVSYETKDPMAKGFKVSAAVIGCIIGGLIGCIVFFICIAVLVKYIKRRRRRLKASRYGNGKFENVKYFGPKTVEANNKISGNIYRVEKTTIIDTTRELYSPECCELHINHIVNDHRKNIMDNDIKGNNEEYENDGQDNEFFIDKSIHSIDDKIGLNNEQNEFLVINEAKHIKENSEDEVDLVFHNEAVEELKLNIPKDEIITNSEENGVFEAGCFEAGCIDAGNSSGSNSIDDDISEISGESVSKQDHNIRKH